MPSHVISLPGARGPSTGIPLGSAPVHVSKSAVHGSTQKPSVIITSPLANTPTLAAPAHVVSTPKTH